jgi:pantothenate kinase
VSAPADLADLASRARGLVRGGRRAVLGITGPPGAGKTTLVEKLLKALPLAAPPGVPAGAWVAHVPMDGFHLADAELARQGRSNHKGAPETFDPAGYLALLRRLRADTDEVVYAPAFDRTLEQPVSGSIPIPPAARLVLTEGNYLLLNHPPWSAVQAELDECWYCHVPEPARLARLLERHQRFGKSPARARAWVSTVDSANAALCQTTRPRADLVVGG